MKTGIFFGLMALTLGFSSFFFSSCASTSYFEDSKAAEKVDTERISAFDDTSRNDQGESEEKEERIFVELQGAVRSPGVFEVEKGTRIFSLITLAGGLLDDADIRGLNQAAIAGDGEKIYIPRKGEENTASEASSGSAGSGKVNLNTADAQALMTLSGVGEAKAKLILDYRAKNGAFKSTEDITKISGIKSGLYEKIKDQITV